MKKFCFRQCNTVTQTQLHSPPTILAPTNLHRLIHIQRQITKIFASFKDVQSYLVTYQGGYVILKFLESLKVKVFTPFFHPGDYK
jgi:hypothetical protein